MFWEVKKEHGPTQGDSDCLTWAYHSHINPMKDVNTGLVGTSRDNLYNVNNAFNPRWLSR